MMRAEILMHQMYDNQGVSQLDNHHIQMHVHYFVTIFKHKVFL